MSLFCAVYGVWGGPIGYQNICGIVKSLIKTYRVSSQSKGCATRDLADRN